MPEATTHGDPAALTVAGAGSVGARVRDSGIVAVMRDAGAGRFPQAAAELTGCGLTALEITLSTPNALDALRVIRADSPEVVVVGAGTVLTAAQAAASVEAGADFLVSPGLFPEVLEVGRSAGIAVYPGAFTTTELVTAGRLGADLVKLFPASAVGPGYVKDLKGPLPDIDIMVTGGIGLDDIPAWIDAGAVAVGLGGPLFRDALQGGSLAALGQRASRALASVRRARERS